MLQQNKDMSFSDSGWTKFFHIVFRYRSVNIVSLIMEAAIMTDMEVISTYRFLNESLWKQAGTADQAQTLSGAGSTLAFFAIGVKNESTVLCRLSN